MGIFGWAVLLVFIVFAGLYDCVQTYLRNRKYCKEQARQVALHSDERMVEIAKTILDATDSGKGREANELAVKIVLQKSFVL